MMVINDDKWWLMMMMMIILAMRMPLFPLLSKRGKCCCIWKFPTISLLSAEREKEKPPTFVTLFHIFINFKNVLQVALFFFFLRKTFQNKSGNFPWVRPMHVGQQRGSSREMFLLVNKCDHEFKCKCNHKCKCSGEMFCWEQWSNATTNVTTNATINANAPGRCFAGEQMQPQMWPQMQMRPQMQMLRGDVLLGNTVKCNHKCDHKYNRKCNTNANAPGRCLAGQQWSYKCNHKCNPASDLPPLWIGLQCTSVSKTSAHI